MSATLTRNAPAPERSLVQRMDALAEANRIRSARARLKIDLKAGRRTVEHILLSPPEYVATMKVYDLLLAAPKIGRVKAQLVLRMCQVAPSKTVAGITDRQRDGLLRQLRRPRPW